MRLRRPYHDEGSATPTVPEVAAGRIEVGGIGLRTESFGPATSKPSVVFLHEGLGSVELWRAFPELVMERIGRAGLAYDRQGHGRSDPMSVMRTPSYLHDAALVELAGVLDATAVQAPLLIGHSDGASIALIHATHYPVSGLVLIAPHVRVELEAVVGIERTDRESSRLIERLSGYHDHPADLYRSWRDTWLSPQFRSWSIESELSRVTAPVLVIQGDGDEYGTLDQLDRIEGLVTGPVTRHVVSGGGHSPHLSHTGEVVDAVDDFTTGVGISRTR